MFVELEGKEASRIGRERDRGSTHEFGEHFCGLLRVTRGDRKMMDHGFLTQFIPPHLPRTRLQHQSACIIASGSNGAPAPDPGQEALPLGSPPRALPLEPFILVGEWERADRDVSRSVSALSHSPTNGQIAKGLALCRRSRRQSLLVGSRAKPLRLVGSNDAPGPGLESSG